MSETFLSGEVDSFLMETKMTTTHWEEGSLQSVTAVPQTQPGATLPAQPHFVGGRKVSPQEGQRELRGAVPLHGHTALKGRELGVILDDLLRVLMAASPTNTGTASALQSQQPLLNFLWGFKNHGRRSPGFLEWE